VIELRNASKSFGATLAVDDVSLTVERGELVVLLGASGSGKSTLLKMINRLVAHDGGAITFMGEPIGSLQPEQLRRRMGYAIQSTGLFPHWSVARNVATVPELLGWPRERIAARVDELLLMLGLDPTLYRTRYPHQLSGGQQQRVGVARALAADPDVLLMDEPFGALDPATRAALQLEMKRVHLVSGKTIVLVTHDMDEALLLATKIVLLDQGRIVQVGTPLDVLANPANDFVMDFVGRSDFGIKLLSLQLAQDIARSQPPCTGPSVPAHTTLRELVSFLTMHQVSAVNLSGPSGQHAGVVHAADIFSHRQLAQHRKGGV
jgi:osmoprotectant transport system ATP-binding protein